LSLGSLVLKIRRKYDHGLRVAYYRDVVRPRILKTRPVEGLTDARCEIHVLTSAKDWLNLVWTLKSFYWTSHRRYALCVHDDGTLDAEARQELQKQFPDARVIDHHVADREILPTLDRFPRCRAFRESNHLSPKLFDFRHYLNSDRMLLLDSDVLFFDEPAELLRRIEEPGYRANTANADVANGYTVEPIDARNRCAVDMPDRFNSGLGLIHRSSIRLNWIEEFLAIPGILGHFWRIEQTLFALCSARFGVELLPDEYRVSLDPGIENCVAKHYVGPVRHLMYREGIAKLVREGILQREEDCGANGRTRPQGDFQ
jgi:hypothetical protein